MSRLPTPSQLLGPIGARIEVEEIMPGVTRLRLSTRALRSVGLEATPCLVGDVLIDAGFAHARPLLESWCEDKRLRAVCCTHHHEDHVGTARALARQHGCPAYLRNPGCRVSEGLEGLPLYRRVYWGEPEPYEAQEMPETIDTAAGTLTAIPTPGHSASHTVFFDERTGVALVGDLYVSGGVTAVMRQENPFESIRSLRRIAQLEPARMLNGHGLDMERPAEALRGKADRLEVAVARILELHRRGWGELHILRKMFPQRWRSELRFLAMTAGDFDHRNFVRAVLRHHRSRRP